MGRTGVQSIRRAGATILLALLCAVSVAPQVQALDTDPPPFGADWLDNADSYITGTGNTFNWTQPYQSAVLFKVQDFWYLYIGTDYQTIKIVDQTPKIFNLEHHYSKAWLIAFNSDGSVDTGHSAYSSAAGDYYTEQGIGALSDNTADRILISCTAYVGGNHADECPTTPFPYTAKTWTGVTVGEAPPPPECDEGYTGTFPDCTLIPPPEETTGGGMTQDELREVIHEYAIKGAGLALASSVAFLIVYAFRWHPRW